MVFSKLFRRDAARDAAHSLYVGLVSQARHPDLYSRLDVPDSLDGRFDSVALHAFLVLNRLKREESASAAALAQHLVDAFVDDMDRSVRELGVGDMGVSRRVKQMAQALYGRAAVYEEAAADPDDVRLMAALARNLYGTREATPPASLAGAARYVRASIAKLADQDMADIAEGRIAFPEPAVPA
jgi:cytochrome b pre-mRNA-processing protein 3